MGDDRKSDKSVANKKNPLAFKRAQSVHTLSRLDESPNTGKKVYVHVSFLKFGEVDTLSEKFDADVLVRSRWREPKLDNVITKNDNDSNYGDWSGYWNPHIFIENSMGVPRISSSISPQVDSDGKVWMVERKRYKGTFMETLELWDFPFDVQDLSVFVMAEYPSSVVQLIEDPKEIHKINRDNFIGVQEWYLYDYLESEKSERAKDPVDPSLKSSTVMVRARAARRPGFFLSNNFLVTFMLVCLSFTTFSVDYTLPQYRLQLSFTIILTTVAFKFVVNQSLPKLSYLTYLDRYMLTCMIELIGLSVWHSIMGAFLFDDMADWIAACCLAGLYLLYNFYFWIRIYFGPYKIRAEMVHKEFDYKIKVDTAGNRAVTKRYMKELQKTLADFDLIPPKEEYNIDFT